MATEDTEAKAKKKKVYVSTSQDRRVAIGLGVFYLILAMVLGYMLFVIWPTIPWPASDKLNPTEQAELEQDARDCGCRPSPSPTPSPSATPKPSSGQATNTGANANSANTPSPQATPTPSVASTTPAGGAGVAVPSASASPETTPKPTASLSPEKSRLPLRLPLKIVGYSICTTFDERLILLVIIAGMLGALVHGATSLSDFVGNNSFKKSWTWFYILRPVIGMGLALVFYFVIRGGFLSTSGGANDINPYGIAALAGLVGMFSKQATDKLGEVFSTLFKSGGDSQRNNPLGGESELTVTDIEPKEIPVGSTNQSVTVTGTGFDDEATVHANGASQKTTFVSATELKAVLPDSLFVTAGTVKLKVVNEDESESEEIDLKVTS